MRQIAPEYEGTQVHHALYLPLDWQPGRSYPVLVEYTGNYCPACGSSGKVQDANLGYCLTGAHGALWVTLPCVADGRRENAITWWGHRQATIDYCSTNLPRICRQFGGDPARILICGFSRGAIATSYIGLANDSIASFWRAFMTHDHFDGQLQWPYPESDAESALRRLARLKGRPVLICNEGTTQPIRDFLAPHLHLAQFSFLDVPVRRIFSIPDGPVTHPHTDLWMNRDSRARHQARAWLARALA